MLLFEQDNVLCLPSWGREQYLTGYPSWGTSYHFIHPLVKRFECWSTNPQKMSRRSRQRVEWLDVRRLCLGTELAGSSVRSTAVERAPFSKNRAARGIAAPADSLPLGFGTGQLIKPSAPRAPDSSQLFSRPEDPGDAGRAPHVKCFSPSTPQEAGVGLISLEAWPGLQKGLGRAGNLSCKHIPKPSNLLASLCMCIYFFLFLRLLKVGFSFPLEVGG